MNIATVNALACGCRPFTLGGADFVYTCDAHAKPKPPARYYVRASVVEAERLDDGRWRVTGRGWLAKGVEFSDEDFRRNFEAL
jgi:hypothetical protein